MQIHVPNHSNCLLHKGNNTIYCDFACKYSEAKRHSFKASVTIVIGSGSNKVNIKANKISVRK